MPCHAAQRTAERLRTKPAEANQGRKQKPGRPTNIWQAGGGACAYREVAVGSGNGGLALHCIACIIEKISSAARGCASTNCFGSHGVPSLHVWMDERYRIAYSRCAANAAVGRLTAEEEGTSDSHAEKAHAASPIDSRGLAYKYTIRCAITSP